MIALDAPVSAHHDMAVHCWRLGPEGGPDVSGEMDVLRLDDGRICAVHVQLTDTGG